METKPRLFLFDAYALIFRSYYAFVNRPMINSKGLNTSAIYGFTTTILDIFNREKPDYAAVVFDPPDPTFRNELYDQYKANRMSTPEEIKKSVPFIKQVLEGFNIPVIEIPGYEADDVIGTLAKTAELEGFMTYMVTPDKDFMQLVTDRIKMLKPGRSGGEYETLGIEQVNEFFGVDDPCKVIDILALWGDSSDNVPGAPGIGEKTARDLIRQYNSLENLLDHVSELKPKQRQSLEENRELVLLSHKLVTIHTHVPVNVELQSLRLKAKNEHKLRELFQFLEFRTLTTRVFKNEQAPAQGTLFELATQEVTAPPQHNLKSILTVAHQYHVLQTETDIDNFIVRLSGLTEFCFDTETTGINCREAELVGMSFCFRNFEAYYIPVPADTHEANRLVWKFKDVFENKGIRKIGQNIKYDIQILLNYQVNVEGEVFDTMIAHYLIQPDLRHSLEYLAEIHLGYKMVPIEDLIGKKGPSQKNMRDVAIETIKEYACEDADITWQLYPILKNEIERQKLSDLAYKIEMPLIRVLAEMENAGFKISQENLSAYSAILKTDIDEIENAIYSLAGGKFNLNSPRQLGEILFEKLQIAEGTQKTKTKQYSTGEEVLAKLADKHPIVTKILDYRALQKLLSTYVDALPKLIDKKTVKIHTSFDQAWVSTGRLSSRNPNLQNIPIRDERGKEIRKAFIPCSSNNVLLSADYSQIELRLMAHLSQDENMIDAFAHNADIHVSTAAKIFRVPEEEVTSSMRSKAKTANFGIIYGISAFGLSQRLNISRSEASALIQGYFSSFPKVKLYMENAIRKAQEKGYVETIMGRRRFLPDIHSANAVVRGFAERNAINAPIQGSAADIIKLAMVNLQKRLRHDCRSYLVLQVHDELILDVDTTEIDKIKDIVTFEMENVMSLSVPLVVDIGIGNNWLEAH
ncbi:MAG TPA: DNA polymerase I [Bacteroidales bacterium]|nr:DNA polymerase I [Bacteroidales bacterium]